MAIEFNCKSCGTTLRVPDEHLGKQARCPKCQNLNVVQSSQPSPPNAAYQINDPYPPQFNDPNPPNKPDNPYSVGRTSVLPAGGIAGPAYQSAHRGGMILALGIMSVVCNVVAVPGILAWILGRADLKQMDAGVMDPEGRGMTQAGMIMGMVMTILVMISIALMVCYILFIIVVLGAAAGGAM